jgi:uncharacterized protein YhbP (UPF0306 family)
VSGDPRAAALRYLRDHNVMTVATDGPEGLWAAAVFYASEDFTLYFLSAPHTRHAANVHAQPRVAATIQEDYREWRDIKGIQLEGAAHALGGEATRRAIEVFTAKYPFVAAQLGPPEDEIAGAMAGIRWYRLVPDRLYFVDNSKGLGHRDEIPLEPPKHG